MRQLLAGQRVRFGRGPFQIRRVVPGRATDTGDTGIAGLGLIDHAELGEGLLVPMHQHRNDEIVSYLRSGEMVHEDSTGQKAVLSASHLMVMNAGRGFSHEESVPKGGVEMLQIFIRPEEAEMEPDLQFRQLEPVLAHGAWRGVAGPRELGWGAVVRQQVAVLDVALQAGESIAAPRIENLRASLVYVFDGTVRIGERGLVKGDAVLVEENDGEVVLEATGGMAQLVAFAIDREAKYTRAGTLSGGM